ncbi:hypothetical protein [Helicobacter gastrofelis]|uniref:hypothetical protein n=1 Tax=Helicobacter gastrofelis TaxID=2849642 RepID=UPI001C85225F|nr:hypothetical protein [Helicobacter sp. NHP19-012]
MFSGSVFGAVGSLSFLPFFLVLVFVALGFVDDFVGFVGSVSSSSLLWGLGYSFLGRPTGRLGALLGFLAFVAVSMVSKAFSIPSPKLSRIALASLLFFMAAWWL